MPEPIINRLTLKELEIVVDDFEQKTIHVDRDLLTKYIHNTYLDELGSDTGTLTKRIGTNIESRELEFITVPRYNCYIKWYKAFMPNIKSQFKVHFVSTKSKSETPFEKTLADFLFFYDNPNGLFRLESLSFLFQ